VKTKKTVNGALLDLYSLVPLSTFISDLDDEKEHTLNLQITWSWEWQQTHWRTGLASKIILAKIIKTLSEN